MHMFYYLLFDCIHWAWTLMNKDYCHSTMYWMYYYVIYLYAYTEMIIVIKRAEG